MAINPRNPLYDLVNLSPEEQDRLGVSFTPAEIQSQPELWPATTELVAAYLERAGDGLRKVLADPRTRIVLTGAGSSHYVGDCLAPALRRATGRVVMSVESTEIVTHPEILAAPGPSILVSFARSGDSPESLGVYRLAKRAAREPLQVVVTCNGQGELARMAAADGGILLALDPRTNDRGLAMTCSFTNLVLAGLGLAYLGDLGDYRRLGRDLHEAGRMLLEQAPSILAALVAEGFDRLVYLGSGSLHGAAREMGLKSLEMTGGAIPSMAQSYLGFRHGPMAFLTEKTLVVAMRSADPYVRRYEEDFLKQLAAKAFAGPLLVVESVTSGSPPGSMVIGLEHGRSVWPDAWLPVLAVPVGQVLALFASLKCGCRPDQPSRGGLISRVVEGVILHDDEWQGL